MNKYQNKYLIPSSRLRNWDYAGGGYYFVTICTAQMVNYFGDILDNKMVLSEIGKLANAYWAEIPNHFQCVKLDAHIIMPNHLHGIIKIYKRQNAGANDPGTLEPGDDSSRSDDNLVQTPALSISAPTAAASKKWKPGTLGVIINQYKRICTINARKIQSHFGWHPRYYDHIIRNDKSYQRIRNYIITNPLNWQKDKYYKH